MKHEYKNKYSSKAYNSTLIEADNNNIGDKHALKSINSLQVDFHLVFSNLSGSS